MPIGSSTNGVMGGGKNHVRCFSSARFDSASPEQHLRSDGKVCTPPVAIGSSINGVTSGGK